MLYQLVLSGRAQVMRFRLSAIITLAAAVVVAVLQPGCAGPRQPDRFDVIIISVDTLRADHLGCYGYGRKTSPAIDRLASDGVLFEQCFVPIPKTTPSMISMLSGLHPKTHGVLYLGKAASEEIKQLTAELRKTVG